MNIKSWHIILFGVFICAMGITSLYKQTHNESPSYTIVYTDKEVYHLKSDSGLTIKSTWVKFTLDGKTVKIPLEKILKIEEGYLKKE